MAAVDKISEWVVWFVVIFWITRKASTQYTRNTCYERSNDARVTSYCMNRYKTQCCYGTCCNNWQYRSWFPFKTCRGSGGYYSKEKCRSFQSTDCCPVVQFGSTHSDWSTCCAGGSTGTSTTKEVTYRRCYEQYTTGYCTNPSSTFCCYGACCGVNDYYNSFRFSKCGYSTCRDYRSTHCCTESWPWKATSCCRSRPTASTSSCCSSTSSTTTTRTTTTNYNSSTSEPDLPSRPSYRNNTTMIVILGGGGGATVILIIVLAVVCAKCSAARRARRQTRTRRTQATSGPRVAGPTPTAAGNMPQPYPHAYMNPAMQTPGSAQGYNPYAEPPPAYNDAVFMTQLRPPDYSAYKDEMPPSYEAVAAENYPRVLAVASAPVVPPPYENNE